MIDTITVDSIVSDMPRVNLTRQVPLLPLQEYCQTRKQRVTTERITYFLEAGLMNGGLTTSNCACPKNIERSV